MVKRISVILIIIIFCSLFVSCMKSGKLDDGECVCYVSLENIPQEFIVSGDNDNYNTVIKVNIKNISTDRIYEINLNCNNDFKSKISIRPGTYKIEYISFSSRNFKNVKVKTREEKVQLSKNIEGEINVYIENIDEIALLSTKELATDKILSYDKFSKMIQIDGKVFNMKDILNYIPFNSDQIVYPYNELTLSNDDYGVKVILINTESESISWNKCKVKSIEFWKNNVVFSGGVNIDMPIREIVHDEHGIYGKPDELGGSIFWTSGLDTTSAIYIDDNTGNTITIETDNDKYIKLIKYEFQEF